MTALAGDYARALLTDIGAQSAQIAPFPAQHPAVSWALSGAMALTGWPDQPPRMCAAPLAACGDGVLLALTSISEHPLPAELTGSKLLGERAAIAGYGRQGAVSAGGSCRFLQAADGWIALNLARPEDWDMVPALIGRDIEHDWSLLSAAVRTLSADQMVAQGGDLGLPIAHHRFPGEGRPWFEIVREPPSTAPTHRAHRPLVVDLSSLWAGPLCGHLLHLIGARVIKVESASRPDGARQGPAAFFDLMNGGKESVALDFANTAGQAQLRGLVAQADIVIEGSRPRALRQLGIWAEDLVLEKPGLTWVGITGYGRTGDATDWVAYGDDAAVAAGLSALITGPDEAPIFCSDAIGDPLAGMHAALVAWHRWRSGAGGLVSIALHDIVSHCIAFGGPLMPASAADRRLTWQQVLDRQGVIAARPQARTAYCSARALGADNAAIFAEFDLPC